MYKHFSNRVVCELKESKKSYFTSNGNNMKLLWSGIKSIISIKKSSAILISKHNDSNGIPTTDSTTMANTFTTFWSM